MEEKEPSLRLLIESLESYIKTSFQLYKYKATVKVAEIISDLVFLSIIFLISVFSIIMLNIALALWLGWLLGQTYLGFLAMAGLYLMVGLFVYLLRIRLIKTPVSNLVVKNLLREKTKEDKDIN